MWMNAAQTVGKVLRRREFSKKHVNKLLVIFILRNYLDCARCR